MEPVSHGLHTHRWLVGIALVALLAMGACNQSELASPQRQVPGGNPERGRQALSDYGCSSCHAIPGVRGADAYVGPPLNAWARRSFISGEFPNQPEVLIRWIQNPPAMAPNTAMPALGVSEEDARHIAAYLYTLR
jgi:cytochrome c2